MGLLKFLKRRDDARVSGLRMMAVEIARLVDKVSELRQRVAKLERRPAVGSNDNDILERRAGQGYV